MNTQLSKAAIFGACLKKQEALLKQFSKEITLLKNEITDHDTILSQNGHSTAERTDVLNTYEGELAFLREEMMTLENLDWQTDKDSVQPGAVVATDKQTFFISISIEDVEVDGQTVYGISTGAPLFGAMRGLKQGDSFQFNDRKYTIKDIY
jgi:transcription elongation GreA/GreB family factor